jgi:hypothetical protein
MLRVSWRAAADGRYWIDAAIGNHDVLVMIDLGLIDPRQHVGLELEPQLYHQLKQLGQLSSFRRRSRRDASRRISWSETGHIGAQLIDPGTRQHVGPVIALDASCGSPGVPNRVGIVFFHLLSGCRVVWELDQQMWSIEVP